MNERGKSDSPIVPGKLPNKGCGAPRPAEGVEGRGLAEGNPIRQTRSRTQSRKDLQRALERIRQAARKEKRLVFTALWHHVYDLERLRESYYGLKRKAAPGVDGETWQHYGENLEENLLGLSQRLRRGAYRAKPVRRTYIPKGDGRQRPIGVTVLEDKIVQRAVVQVLEVIYETDFKGFSYGFRPGRSAHDALDALAVGIRFKKVSWVLDADIRGFFDTISHEWLIKFIEHRIGDRRVIRHIRKWLKAGVMEEGKRMPSEEGTPQGGSVSPLLANIYLHYALDLWADQWRRKQAKGDVIIVRYADDIVFGFQYRLEAMNFLGDLRRRLSKFNLELHDEKTRLIEFGRFAAEDRRGRGEGKPETFDFLGFTHICGKNRKGKFMVLRHTIRRRLRAKLKELKRELRRRMHIPIPEVGRWLRTVLVGHYRYYGVPGNGRAMNAFRFYVGRLWLRMLRRRSQRARLNWERMSRLIKRWLPVPRIQQPYPEQRLRVFTQGRSPVR
ncbi:MAG: group II intron reverse transcriptase/maturase [Anaerolineales bacterium]|nr:group II intron reverse transcriptase/maturase [Anaerolineales bacterium]